MYWACSVARSGSNCGQNNVRVWPGYFLRGQCMEMYSFISVHFNNRNNGVACKKTTTKL